MITVDESGMKFGPFDASKCFVVENSATHSAVQPGIQIAEFVVIRDVASAEQVQLWIVEAKSSTPNPASPLPDAAVTFDSFICEIRDKLTNALVLAVTASLGRHPATMGEIPTTFGSIAWGKISFRLILVVKGHQAQW